MTPINDGPSSRLRRDDSGFDSALQIGIGAAADLIDYVWADSEPRVEMTHAFAASGTCPCTISTELWHGRRLVGDLGGPLPPV